MAFTGDSIFWVEVEKIVPNPFQPRREFDESKLKELAESIRMYGILQPLTVTRKEIQRQDGTFYSEYELIAGERRLRASRLAGLSQVPVIIRDGEQSEQEKLELAIIENLQREDLNAVDRALAFRQLADAFGLSHQQVATKVGRSREYVSNSIRLLALPDYMLESLKQGDISEGHARTLLMLNDKPEEQDTVYREILLKKMSVRETERIARKIAHEKVRKKDWVASDPQLMEIERQFTESLGTRVQIMKTDYGGKLTIDYFSVDDLEKMLTALRQEQVTAEIASSSMEEEATLAADTPLSDIENATPLEVAPEALTPSEVASPAAVHDTTPPPHPTEPAPVAESSEVPRDTEAAMPLPEAPKSEPVEPQSAPLSTPVPPQNTYAHFAPTAAEESHTNPADSHTESPMTPTEHTAPEAVPEQPKKSPDPDDSNLYSIRSFSI